MRIYIAASLTTKDQASSLALMLEKRGHVISSTWHEIDTGYSRTEKQLIEDAKKDIEELQSSEVVIHSYTEVRSSGGGADAELGMALALGKDVYVLGPRTNIFHWGLKCFNSESTLMDAIEVVKEPWKVRSLEQRGDGKIVVGFKRGSETHSVRLNWYDATSRWPIGIETHVLPEDD